MGAGGDPRTGAHPPGLTLECRYRSFYGPLMAASGFSRRMSEFRSMADAGWKERQSADGTHGARDQSQRRSRRTPMTPIPDHPSDPVVKDRGSSTGAGPVPGEATGRELPLARCGRDPSVCPGNRNREEQGRRSGAGSAVSNGLAGSVREAGGLTRVFQHVAGKGGFSELSGTSPWLPRVELLFHARVLGRNGPQFFSGMSKGRIGRCHIAGIDGLTAGMNPIPAQARPVRCMRTLDSGIRCRQGRLPSIRCR